MEIQNRSLFGAVLEELGGVHNKLDYLELASQDDINSSIIADSLNTSMTPVVTNSTSPPAARDEFLAKIEQSVLLVIFILTVTGNFLVLMGIYLRKQKMTRMYYFIVHLCIADLTTAFFQVLTQLAWELTYRFQGGPFWCKFVKYTQILGPYSSSYILVMTALDRYQAICNPLSNCSWTARRTKMMLGGAWTLALACCLPQLHIFSYQEVVEGVFDCWATFVPGWGEKAYITWYCISVFIIPLIILVFAYTCITRVIWLNFSQKSNAVIEEQRPGGGRIKEDSEEGDETEFNHGSGGNKALLHENLKNSERGTPAERRILEVSWHHNKSGATTKTSMSNEVSASTGYHKCQPNFGPDLLNDRPRLMDGTHRHLSASGSFSKGNGHKSNSVNYVSSSDNRKNYGDPRQTSPEYVEQSLTNIPEHDSNLERCQGGSEKLQTRRTLSTSFSGNDAKRNRTVKGSSPSFITPSPNQKNGRKNLSKTMSVRSTALSLSTVSQGPRTHSIKGISRAKIKTFKLTVTVICCYICCSTPFIAALLWSAYDPYAKDHPFFYGPTFTIVTLLASLNSCANPWIILAFNPNLFESFMSGTFGRICRLRQHPGGSSTLSNPRNKQAYNNRSFTAQGRRPGAGATSVTALSPLMTRPSQRADYGDNRPPQGQEKMELIPQESGSKEIQVVPEDEGPTSVFPAHNGHSNYPTRDSANPIETSFVDI